MALTNTQQDKDKQVDSKPEQEKETKLTAKNVSNEQLATLLWLYAGSPLGSVDDWLQDSKEREHIS